MVVDTKGQHFVNRENTDKGKFAFTTDDYDVYEIWCASILQSLFGHNFYGCNSKKCPVKSLLLAQSFSPFSARDGRQVCRPAMNFSVTKMQEEKKIAQLVFLKQNTFSFYFQNTSFFVWPRKT
jgi:hypothetical protein